MRSSLKHPVLLMKSSVQRSTVSLRQVKVLYVESSNKNTSLKKLLVFNLFFASGVLCSWVTVIGKPSGYLIMCRQQPFACLL